MKQNIQPAARRSELVVQNLGHEILIYDLSINKAFCLNETSAMVYQLSDGRTSVAEIADLMSAKLKMSVSEEFVWLALDQLKKDNLLEDKEQIEIDFNGLSRRQVIRKIGFASMIALPLVSSVIAPSAANAQSGACVAPGGTCIDAGGTQSNCCDNDQRCVGAACYPCAGSGFIILACAAPGCCRLESTTTCCNPGPVVELSLGSFVQCRCP